MSTFKDLQLELRNKERSVRDLIRFVKTRADENPNYSLFLGAGCSITSGIKSANELIEEWKKEIYFQENDIDENINDASKMNEYYLKQMWYDSRNPYSALFEKKYDLPRQRRMFVEQEVRDKIPSIGYSYLVKLVENNYFKTLFTTNFDDLLNEAFYQYSTKRPILCAHDSAISSVTVTSKRPKIIKLHGDYLFDDIKSTLRETESLEENIKNKFVEFAKDYGLIVVGYGGNDRSIVDILTYLLKNEEYFKNGIYWCLRDDSEINEDLRKLLWKDRVYYVNISGFDELMAEMNHKLNDAILPIDSSYLNEKKDILIEQLVSNRFLANTKCKYIKNDFAKLNNTKEKDLLSNFFKYLKTKDDNSEKSNDEFILKDNKRVKVSDNEGEYLKEIQQELFTGNYDHAYVLVNKKIDVVDKDSQFYVDLIEIKAKCLRHLHRFKEAIECYKVLLSISRKDISNYIILSRLVENIDEKIEYLDKALLIDPYYSILHTRKADILFKDLSENIDKVQLSNKLDNLIEIVDKSIEVDPTVRNPIWALKLDLIKEKYKDDDVVIEKITEIISDLEKQDKHFPELVKIKVELLELTKEKIDNIYSYVLTSIKKSNSDDYLKYNELTLLRLYASNNNLEELKKRIIFIEENYTVDDDYLELKAVLQLEKFDKLSEAIGTLKSIKKKSKDVYKILFNYMLYAKDYSGAEDVIINKLGGEKKYYEEFYSQKKEYHKALDIVVELLENDENNYNLCVSESYLLLKTGQFQSAYNKLSKHLKHSNFTDPYLLINYYIAMNKYKGSIKEDKIKEKLFNGTKQPDLIEAAAYSLLKDSKNAFTKLSSAINKDYSRKYVSRDWIVFEDMLGNDKFKKLLNVPS